MILTERLTINGEVIPIAGYSIKTPTGGIGRSLSIALVEPDLSLLPADAEITFEIGAGRKIGNNPVDYSYIPILENGRLLGLNYSAGWLDSPTGGKRNDLLEFNALSPLADKLGLAPARPVITYNPALIEASKLIPEQSQLIRSKNQYGIYEYLTPILDAKENLDLYYVLDRAYTNRNPLEHAGGGCGFSSVITNVPNLPIDRVDFTLQSGWHSPAAALYTLFKVEAFEENNILYLISPEYGLPPGFIPQTLPPECVININRSQEGTALANALIMSYDIQASGGTGTGGERIEIHIINEPPRETGAGTNAYLKTETSREVTQFFDIVTDDLRREEENYINTKTSGYRQAVTTSIDGSGNVIQVIQPGGIVPISEEHVVNTYSGKTKSGYHKTFNSLYRNPDSAGAAETYGLVTEETNRITWQPDIGHPGEYTLVFSETRISGLCLVENIEIEEEFPPTGQTVKYTHKIYTPILDAQTAGLVTGAGTQTKEWRELYTITETLRQVGVNQSTVETRIFNHLTGTYEPPNTQSRTGANTTYIPPLNIRFAGVVKAGQIQELIKNDASIAAYGFRKAANLDIGRLDPVEGRKIAERQLRLTINPPRKFNITLPGINFNYHRGSIIIPPLRSGYDNAQIITGLDITGRALHTPNARRNMVLETRELIANA